MRERPPAAGGDYKLVANLPYDVATPVLIELLILSATRASTLRIPLFACTIQKEVGERLRAGPDTDAYGPISVIAPNAREIEVVAPVPPTAFWPQPQIESTMLALRLRPPDQVDLNDVHGFAQFVRNGFMQRRKMLLKRLDVPGQSAEALLERVGVNPLHDRRT